MRPTIEILGHRTREAAKVYAQLVLPHVREYGEDVDATKARMVKWINALVAYEVDTTALRSSDMDDDTKAMILGEMRAARESLRMELFG